MSMLRQPRLRRPNRLRRTLYLLALLAGAALLLAACNGQEPAVPAESAHRTITVTGTGEVAAQPDITMVRSGYWVKDEDANVAIANASARLAEITAGLTALGIDPADIAAPGPSMNSEQIFGPDGYPTDRLLYAVNQDVAVTVRDPGLVGDVLNSLRVTAGAPYLYSLNVQPEFSPQRWDQLLAEAQAEALTAAQVAAENLAQQLGLALAEPLSVKVLGQDASGGPLLPAQVIVEVSYRLQAGDPVQD